MQISRVLWDLDDDPDGNVQHIAEHGLTIDEVEAMPKRIRRNRKLNAEEVARLREERAEFSGRRSKARLLQSGDYAGPMSTEEYLSWRKRAGDVPLARQLQAAIAATGQLLAECRAAEAQASGDDETP